MNLIIGLYWLKMRKPINNMLTHNLAEFQLILLWNSQQLITLLSTQTHVCTMSLDVTNKPQLSVQWVCEGH